MKEAPIGYRFYYPIAKISLFVPQKMNRGVKFSKSMPQTSCSPGCRDIKMDKVEFMAVPIFSYVIK